MNSVATRNDELSETIVTTTLPDEYLAQVIGEGFVVRGRPRLIALRMRIAAHLGYLSVACRLGGEGLQAIGALYPGVNYRRPVRR